MIIIKLKINSLLMYLFKNTTYLIKIKINLLLILSILFFSTNIYAEEKFVGFIESLDGKAFKKVNEEKIKLNVSFHRSLNAGLVC